MNFCKVEAGHLCWIYPKDRLILLPNVARTTLLSHANLSYLSNEEDFVRPNPPHPLLGLPDLIPPPNYPALIMVSSTTPLGPFKRSKTPLEPMSHLSMPPFVILSKSGMISLGG